MKLWPKRSKHSHAFYVGVIMGIGEILNPKYYLMIFGPQPSDALYVLAAIISSVVFFAIGYIVTYTTYTLAGGIYRAMTPANEKR